MNENFHLTHGELASAAWQKIYRRALEKREQYRTELEGDIPESKTARLRGRLDEVNALIRLNTPPELVDPAPKDYHRF